MKPWEFIIATPTDLPVFADLLAEWDHPGEEVVRWLIKYKKWPDQCKAGWGYTEDSFNWHSGCGRGLSDCSTYELSDDLFQHDVRITEHTSITEAIWSVIIRWIYVPKTGTMAP